MNEIKFGADKRILHQLTFVGKKHDVDPTYTLFTPLRSDIKYDHERSWIRLDRECRLSNLSYLMRK